MWPEGSELIWQLAESRRGAWEREGTLTQVSFREEPFGRNTMRRTHWSKEKVQYEIP